MKNNQILSINLDMGAKNNGVYICEVLNDEVKQLVSKNILFDKNGINFKKIDRTSIRHTRRGILRPKLAKKLLREILKAKSPKLFEVLNDKNHINNIKFNETLNGLFKNRGFNYIDLEFDELGDESFELLSKIEDYKFKNCKSKEDFEEEFTRLFEIQNKDEVLFLLDEQSKLLEDRKKEVKKQKDLDDIINLFSSIKTGIVQNKKHRSEYFKDLKNEISSADFKEIINLSGLSKDDFHKLICNISNFQLKILRRYFNDKFDDIYDDDKLKKQILRYLNSASFISKEEKENEIYLNEILKNNFAFDFLIKTNPVKFIQPYENHKNKNGLKCDILTINEKCFEEQKEHIKNALIRLLNMAEYEILKINHLGELANNEEIENNLSFYLQRFLDANSKLFDEDKKLSPRRLKTNEDDFFQKELLEKDYLALKNIAIKYYEAVENSKKGLVDDRILISCCKNTPHKNNAKELLLSALFMKEFSKEDYAKLFDFMKNNKVKGNSTFKSVFENLYDLRADYGNSFYGVLSQEFEKFDKSPKHKSDFKFELIKQAREKLFDFNVNLPFKEEINSENISTYINYFIQMFDIMFSPGSGFLKNCRHHETERLLRLYANSSKSICSQLPTNSARLFNGKMEMYLNRLAFEIANLIKDNKSLNPSEIQINIEMNKFNFEESAKEINLKSDNKKRAKKQKEFICPYSGNKINENNCDYDHILPRSKIKFDSVANLIPVSSEANLMKSNKKYSLRDLNEKYLNDIYKKMSFKPKNLEEFKNFIETEIQKIDEKNYSNFYNLKPDEQIAFRHALFLDENDEAFKKAKKLLEHDQIKAPSNGTQKRLVFLLHQNLKKVFDDFNVKINFPNSKLVNATRRDLNKSDFNKDENFGKQDRQDYKSHCIDASVVFYLSNQKDLNLNKEIYFTKINPKSAINFKVESKKYLELKDSQIARKQLFDDSIYGGEFISNISNKEKEILENLRLFKNKNGKKLIDSNKVFALIFKYFEEEDSENLKKIEFINKYLKKFKKVEITSEFYEEKKDKLKNKTEKELEKQGKFYQEFYKFLQDKKPSKLDLNRFYEAFKRAFIFGKFDEDKFQIAFNDKSLMDSDKKRGRNKVIYSIKKYVSEGKFIRRRQDGGFDILSNADIATKTYFDSKNKELIKLPFYSKNILPLSIKDLLSIIENTNLSEIYETVIKDLPEGIKNLKIILSEKSRHQIFVNFDRKSEIFKDVDFSKLNMNLNQDNEEFVSFTNEFLNGIFKSYLGFPRKDKKDGVDKFGAQLEFLSNQDFSIFYKAQQTSAANKKMIVENLRNETLNN